MLKVFHDHNTKGPSQPMGETQDGLLGEFNRVALLFVPHISQNVS